MRVKLIFHGFLKELFSDSEYDVSTPAEAIKAWSIQNRSKLKDKPLLQIEEAPTEAELYSNIHTEELNISPYSEGAGGGGGGGFIKIVIGVVLIVAGFMIPGSTPFLAKLGTALITAGVATILGGVLELLSPAPKLDMNLGFDFGGASSEDKKSNYLGAPGNTTKIGTPIPIGYGRFKLSGHYLSYNINAVNVLG